MSFMDRFVLPMLALIISVLLAVTLVVALATSRASSQNQELIFDVLNYQNDNQQLILQNHERSLRNTETIVCFLLTPVEDRDSPDTVARCIDDFALLDAVGG
jgi:type II secretory pathway pseudopilin PulG